MQTTVTIDDDVYVAIEARAAAEGKPIGQLLSELARTALLAPASVEVSKTGFPTFSVPPDSPTIPASRAAEIMADELP